MPASRPDLASLELLVAVADHGSLSAAATALGVAQPNASRQLSRLERRLGARLIDRGARGSEATEAGRVAIEHARRVLDDVDGLVEGVRRADGRGALRIRASQTIAEHLMPVFLSALSAQLPGTPVGFEVGNSTEVLDSLRRGRTDLGFVEGAEVPAGITSLEVARDHLVAVVAPSHPWAHRATGRAGGVPERTAMGDAEDAVAAAGAGPATGTFAGIDADELARTPLVVREPGSGTRDVLSRVLCPRPMAEPAVVVHSNAAVRTAVAAGAGPAVLSSFAVAEAVADGRVVQVPLAGLDLQRSLRAVWIGARSPRLDGPLDALRAAFSGRAGTQPRG